MKKNFIHILTCDWQILVGITGLATVTRLLYLRYFIHDSILQIHILDAQYYLNWAEKIVHTGLLGTAIFFAEPLYAYILAFGIKLFNTTNVIIVLQFVLGALLPVVVFYLAQRVSNHRSVALISAIITAIYGPFIFYESLLLKTSLEVFSLTLLVLITLHTFAHPSRLRFFLSGLFLGIVILLKANSLIVIPVILFFIGIDSVWKKRNKWLYATVFISGVLLIILPVTLRNYLVGNDLVLTNYSLGMNVYQGNWWGADGSLLQPTFIRPDPTYEEHDSKAMAEALTGHPLKPSQISNFWLGQAISENLADPLHVPMLIAKKFILLITPFEMSDNYDYAFYVGRIPILNFLPSFLLIAPLALLTIVLLLVFKDFRRFFQSEHGSKAIFLAFLASYLFVLFFGHVNSRYRLPAIPLVIILASMSIYYAYQLVRNIDLQKTGLLLLGFIGCFLLANVHLQNFDALTPAISYNNIGSYYKDHGDYLTAMQYFEKSIQADDQYLWSYSNEYDIYLEHGEVALAQDMLKKMITLRPDEAGVYDQLAFFERVKDKPTAYIIHAANIETKKGNITTAGSYDPYFYEAQRLMQLGDYQTAYQDLQKSASTYANPSNTLLTMASLERSSGDTQKATEHLQTVIRKNPYFLPAYYNLANIYMTDKNHAKAIPLLKKIYDLDPEFQNTWYNYAVQLVENKQNGEAVPVIKGYIKQYNSDYSKLQQVSLMSNVLQKIQQDQASSPSAQMTVSSK